jgi:hypothetical protein
MIFPTFRKSRPLCDRPSCLAAAHRAWRDRESLHRPWQCPAFPPMGIRVEGVSRILAPFATRVIIAHPLQVKAMAQPHVATDKIEAGGLANLRVAFTVSGYPNFAT